MSQFWKRRTVGLVGVLILLVLAGCAGYQGGQINETAGDDGFGEAAGEEINETEVEAAFIARLNDARSERGLRRLSQRDVLTEMGASHAADMREHGYTGHQDSEGRTIEDRYRNRNLLPECELPAGENRYYAGAENAAMGHIDKPMDVGWVDGNFRITSEEDIAQFLYQGWRHSEGHRRVLFLESASEIGLGIAVSDDDELYAAMEVC